MTQPTLLFLYGPPAVGKLTVARAVADISGFRVLHNHLVNDAVHAVLEYGAPGFWELVREVRTALVRAAASARIDLVLTYVHAPGDEQRTEAYAALYEDAGGRACFVRLLASRETLLRRVGDASRRSVDKITEQGELLALLDEYDVFQPLAGRPSLTVDTEQLTPALAAEHIVRELDL